MAYLGVAVLGTAVVGVAVLGTAVLGVAVVGTVVLGIAVLGTGVLHSQNGSSNPALGGASLSQKKHHTACMRKSTSLTSSSRWSSEDG